MRDKIGPLFIMPKDRRTGKDHVDLVLNGALLGLLHGVVGRVTEGHNQVRMDLFCVLNKGN